jgi:hypothetical protein
MWMWVFDMYTRVAPFHHIIIRIYTSVSIYLPLFPKGELAVAMPKLPMFCLRRKKTDSEVRSPGFCKRIPTAQRKYTIGVITTQEIQRSAVKRSGVGAQFPEPYARPIGEPLSSFINEIPFTPPSSAAYPENLSTAVEPRR